MASPSPASMADHRSSTPTRTMAATAPTPARMATQSNPTAPVQAPALSVSSTLIAPATVPPACCATMAGPRLMLAFASVLTPACVARETWRAAVLAPTAPTAAYPTRPTVRARAPTCASMVVCPAPTARASARRVPTAAYSTWTTVRVRAPMSASTVLLEALTARARASRVPMVAYSTRTTARARAPMSASTVACAALTARASATTCVGTLGRGTRTARAPAANRTVGVTLACANTAQFRTPPTARAYARTSARPHTTPIGGPTAVAYSTGR